MLQKNKVKLYLHGAILFLLILPTIRVAILKEMPGVTIQGEELRIKLPEAKPLSTYIASPVNIEAIENGFKVGNGFYLAPSIQINSVENSLMIDGKRFEGTIEIQRQSNNKLLILNELPLEEYLGGVVPGEIPPSWPKEAIKAQIVAARTYALYRQNSKGPKKNYDLESDTSDQVYLGAPPKIHDKYLENIIAETKGEVLWFLGLYPAYFHSACGGQTETTQKVWGFKEPSQSVIDPFCKKAPHFHWELTLSQNDLLDKLSEQGLEGNMVKTISLERFENSPRNALVTIETDKMNLYVKPNDLRKILGFNKLMSAWFTVETTPRKVTFKGTGYGHGVGLCQWGAKAMAEAGADYKKILEFYYPKAVLRKLY